MEEFQPSVWREYIREYLQIHNIDIADRAKFVVFLAILHPTPQARFKADLC
jgi:hypothetical protein